MKIFISHSSKDTEVVKALVSFIRSALPISKSEIRCTSLGGYQLPAGVSIDKALRSEVNDAIAFIGLISHSSLKSLYVSFEWGARWGTNKYFIPLMAPGVKKSDLKEPLTWFNIISCENDSQLHRLIKDLSKKCHVKANAPHLYSNELNKVITLPRIFKLSIPKYIEDELTLDYSERKKRLVKGVREILEYIESESKSPRLKKIFQESIETRFEKRYHAIYWRLETLCYLGFIEKEEAGEKNGITTFKYNLTEEYKSTLV